MLRCTFTFLISLLIFTKVISQTHENYQVKQYSTENGLPSNGIKGMQLDEQTGFLWIATEAGVIRFNGIDFETYTKKNTPFIESERMQYMIRNNSGNIFTADEQGNIFIVNQNKLVLWKNARGNSVYNNDFALLASETLFQKKITLPECMPFPILNSRIFSIADSACFIIFSEKLYYYSLSTACPVYIPLKAEPIKSIFKINDHIFISNNKKEISELSITDERKLVVPIVNENGEHMDLSKDTSFLYSKNGMENTILFTGNKAWNLEYKGDKIIASQICTDIPKKVLIRFVQYSKKYRMLFIGTDSKGIFIIRQNHVQQFRPNSGRNNDKNAYYSQLELPNGNVLTNEGHIIGAEKKTYKKMPITGKFNLNIYLTPDSVLWFMQNNSSQINCLHNYNYKTAKTTAYPKIKTRNYENVVLKQSSANGQLYAATSSGIAVLSGDSLKYIYLYSKYNRFGNMQYDMLEVKPGIFVVAACNALMRFEVATAQLDTIFSTKGNCIRSLWLYRDYLFLGTYGKGFYVFKNGVAKAMPLDKNNYLLYTHCFVPDDNGFCWISTNRGLFKAKTEDIIDAYNQNTPQVYYHYFGYNDGMDLTEMNGGCTPCALKLKNKLLSFPTMDGLIWANPQKPISTLPEGPIYIDEISVDNKIISIDSIEQIAMQAGTKEILIKLSYSAWCNNENIYIEYRLNDTEKWKQINLSHSSTLTFSNLPAGNYSLAIRKLNGFGHNNYTYKYLKISIESPPYKQWWFFLLMALPLAAMAFLFYRLRLRQLKLNQRMLEKIVDTKTKELKNKNDELLKSDRIKTRLISIISHDIITPLKFINLAGIHFLEKRKLLPIEPDLEVIQEIASTSKELEMLSTNILNWIKYQNEQRRLVKELFNAHEMVQHVLEVLNTLAKQKQIPLINEVNKDLIHYQFFEPLKIIIYNLVSNAIHFADKGSIIISSKKSSTGITLSVKDEGIGMTAEQIKNIMADEFIISSLNVDNKKGNGLGYLIIKDLLKLIEATIQIKSEKGKYTIVEIHLS